jgi:hypothetical protein
MLFILAAVLIIFLIDGIPLIKKKQWAELITWAFILILALVLFTVKDIGIIPLKMLNELFRGAGKKLFG